MSKVATLGSLLAAVTLIASCSASGSSGSSSPAASSALATSSSSSASQPTPPEPTTFTSATYGYTFTLPPEWTGTQATQAWDIHAGFGLNTYSFQADQFRSASTPAAYAVAARWKQDLAALARFWISDTTHYHGDYCPPKPTTRNPITIGGQPGVLLAYNCGILVNIAVTVHHGVGYNFSFVDDSVPSATDPTDHAMFAKMLRSIQFPD
jgi:hypothetical protein